MNFFGPQATWRADERAVESMEAHEYVLQGEALWLCEEWQRTFLIDHNDWIYVQQQTLLSVVIVTINKQKQGQLFIADGMRRIVLTES